MDILKLAGKTPIMVPYDLKAGDIIGFSGRHWYSAAINICTLGIPYHSISHVGIVSHMLDGCYGGRLLMFESTDEPGDPCEVKGKIVAGVQAHSPYRSIEYYNGKVWHYPLHRRLYLHEECRLTGFLDSMLGLPYDNPGAVRSGGFFFSMLESAFRGQDLSRLFCSELVAASLSATGIFHTTNASRWSPNKLIRRLRLEGIIHAPRRLK